jgi:hypothetical protein
MEYLRFSFQRDTMKELLSGIAITALLVTNAGAANLDIVSAPQGWRLTIAQDYCSATVEYENGAKIGVNIYKNKKRIGIDVDFKHVDDNMTVLPPNANVSIDFDGKGTVYAMKYLPDKDSWSLSLESSTNFIESLIRANVLNYREDGRVTPYSLAGSASALDKAFGCALGENNGR